MSTILDAVLKSLRQKFSDHLVALALFGSEARGGSRERSDLDFLVVLRGIPKTLERRYEVYKPIYDATTTASGRPRDITVMDLDEEFVQNRDAEVGSLMLNIVSDAVVLYDPDGELASFIDRVRNLIRVAGLQRYSTKDGKYGWKPREGILRAVEA